MGWRQTAASLLLAAGVGVTAILQPLVGAAQLLPLSILKGSMDGANSHRQIQAVVASAGLWGCETQVQGITSREAPTPRIQRPAGPGGLSHEWGFRVAQGGQLPASLLGLPLQQGAGLLALPEPGFQAAGLSRTLLAEPSAAPQLLLQ